MCYLLCVTPCRESNPLLDRPKGREERGEERGEGGVVGERRGRGGGRREEREGGERRGKGMR